MPKKHQRKTISSTFSPEDQPHRPPGTSATNRRKDQLLVAKEPPPTHYISDSSDEDLGEPLQATSAPSPDQLDSFQTPQTTRQDNKATILKPLSILPSHARAKSPRPEAGSSRSSPIECYDDDGDEDERPKPTGLVQQRVHDIEKNSGPRLNLLHAQNPGPKKTAKERMRSKQVGKTFEEVITTSPRHPSEPNDPVATSSTAFIHIDKGKGKEPARKPPVDDTIILPVEEWCLGKLYMPNQCIILYEPDRPAFSVAYEDVTEMARFGLLKEVQV
ncbi:hypothetical protein VNI00_002705 [Paramarasmius palmivorus]|uniref:Uncharacterized protein n=1 Tax=Paramarasmius palmivorus TaxID=297713 RepID=A0AAW0DY28_9AGAR